MGLKLRIIDHEGHPYLRRYYIGTIFGVRVYLHHFVDSDPVGLHNHPFKFSFSFLLSGIYQEERRWCLAPNPRTVRFLNVLGADSMHRIILFRDNDNEPRTVWTLFFHTRKVMPWATIKDKGIYKQYYEEYPENEMKDGHSQWHLTAKYGRDLLNADGTLKRVNVSF